MNNIILASREFEIGQLIGYIATPIGIVITIIVVIRNNKKDKKEDQEIE